ncbi:MAG: PAS domain S-box protein [Anaerolineae bacterium]|nr:PAS domain S-box protein [Anaerolineae bacterium]
MARSSHTILVVDDEITNLQLLSQCLEQLGCRILVARDGKSALSKAEYGRPDLILLDVLMPGIDGFETCRQLKADESLRDIPVVFMSSLVETGDKVRGFEVGAVDYITKPFQHEEVLARLDTHLRLRSLTRELQEAKEAMERQNEKLEREIAERKLAEEVLQEKEEQLRTLINAMPDIVIFKDGQGRYLEANDFELRLFGLEGVDYRGKTDRELAEFTPFYHDALATCEKTDEVTWQVRAMSRQDEVIPRPDGSSRIFDVIKLPTFYGDGSRKGLVVVGRDVTERKHAEEALREAHADLEQRVEERTTELRQANEQLAQEVQERTRAEEEIKNAHRRLGSTLQFITTVMSAIPIPIFYKDREGRYIGVNDAFAELLGFTPEYYAGKTVMELWPDEFAEMYHQKDLELMDNPERQIYEFKVLDKNGVVHPAIWCKYVFRDENGQVAGIVGAFQDITERKQAEEALRESEERYRALYEDNPSMYFTVDPAGTVLSVNQFGCEQLGYSASELVGQSVLNVFHDDDKETAVGSMALCVENPGRVFHWELRKVHKTGRVIWVKEAARAMQGHDGQIAVFIVCEDITEHKRLVEEREKLQAQMIQAQKMEALGQLAGGIAHDFGNLLTIIQLNTTLMKRQLLDQDPLAQHVREIAETGERAVKLTQQLLSFGRRVVIEARWLSLNDVIRGLVPMLRRILGSGIELKVDLTEDLWSVKVDPSQMEQVIVNLVVNARDAMPQGGILTVQTNNVVLDEVDTALHVEAQLGEHVCLTIGDTGVGMSAEVKARIFEPFFTTKEPGRGTGLGLAIVFGIVKQNGGHIQVSSQVGQGTICEIYLPTKWRNSDESRE